MSRLTPYKSNNDQQEEEPELPEREAVIFDAATLGEEVPSGFDSVRIPINGKLNADLSWKAEHKAAMRSIEKGYRVFWEIDLGFYTSLSAPIGNNTQFLSLCLSLEHFRDTLWRDFGKQSIGICLYRGTLDFSNGYPWDEEQVGNLQEWMRVVYPDPDLASEEIGVTLSNYSFVTPSMLSRTKGGRDLVRLYCRDAVGDYLAHLASHLPDTIPSYALFDASALNDPLQISQLVVKERYSPLRIGLKGQFANGSHLLGGELGWDSNRLRNGCLSRELQEKSAALEAPLAICLPKMEVRSPAQTERLMEVMLSLCSKQELFRVIPEGEVLMSWEGLERLIVDSRLVDKQLFRVLQGFAAAGGVVCTLGELLGLFGEESYS